jgi:hypothetical protein
VGCSTFGVGLAEGLWKTKDKLIPSGGTPGGTPTNTAALDLTIDGLIIAAISECCSPATPSSRPALGFGYYSRPAPAQKEQKNLTRILKLLDLMVLTHKTQHSDRLITSISQPQGNILAKYEKLITPLVPQLKARYQQYSSSEFPVLDAFLRALVERWLQDLLGSPSQRPGAFVKNLTCECQDCTGINKFLRSDAETETFTVAQKRRSHMEANLRNNLPDVVVVTTTTGRSPQGLRVTKTQGTLTTEKWSWRVENARAFVSLVGTPDVLARIMGDRYQDVEAALAGTKRYKINKPAPIVANPPVASTSAVQAKTSGTRTAPVKAGMKRKAVDDGDTIDLTSD